MNLDMFRSILAGNVVNLESKMVNWMGIINFPVPQTKKIPFPQSTNGLCKWFMMPLPSSGKKGCCPMWSH